MSVRNIVENDISATTEILHYVASIKNQALEMVLTEGGAVVGAVITAKQYNWFLGQIDAQQDLSFVEARANDREGSQSLVDLKKELGL